MKTLLAAVFAGLLLNPTAVTAADPMAVVILTPASGIPERCSLAGEAPQVLLLYHPRIGERNAVRLAPDLGATVSPAVFLRMKTVGLKDLRKLEMRKDGLMMASDSATPTPRTSVPNRKPAATITVARMYDTVFKGELRQGKTRQRRTIPLKQIWKVYFIPEGSSPDDSLFAHATEERSVAQWSFYWKEASNHRAVQAADRMILAANDCINSAMKSFHDGNFSASERALDTARRLARTVPAGVDIAYIEARAVEVREAVQKVLDSIDQGTALAREQNWDAALGAWAPVRIFASDPALRDFAAAYAWASRESYDLHVNAGANILASARGGGPASSLADADLRKVLAHCETALSRWPQGEQGQACRAEAAIRLAISEALRLRTAGDLRAAGATLSPLIPMKGRTSGYADLDRTLGESMQEISRDLLSAATRLLGTRAQTALPPVSESEKTIFREAREMLLEAESLAHFPEAEKLLRSVNDALAKFHVRQGGKALADQQPGLAFLHALAAGSFAPDNPDYASLRDKSRDAAQKRSRVHVKVLFTDSSPKRSCKAFIDEFTLAAESAIAGVPNARAIDSRQTGRIRSARSAGAKLGRPEGDGGINAVLSANISVCGVFVEDHLQDVQSYTGPLIEEPYTYREGTVMLRGRIAFELQIQDRSLLNISRPVEGNAGSLSTCFERTGVSPADHRNYGGLVPPHDDVGGMVVEYTGKAPKDVRCSVNKGKELTKLAQEAKNAIRAKAAEIVRAAALRHVENARLATDPDTAADHYAAFLLASPDPTGAEYREALDAIRARDPDFKPELITTP